MHLDHAYATHEIYFIQLLFPSIGSSGVTVTGTSLLAIFLLRAKERENKKAPRERDSKEMELTVVARKLLCKLQPFVRYIAVED